MARRSVLTQSKKKKAHKFAQQGNIHAARELYGKVCQTDPQDFESWLNFGAMSAQLGAMNDAQYAFARAYELRPEEPSVSYNLARLSELKQDWLSAEKFYRDYLKLKPGATDALGHLALMYINLGRAQEAVDCSRELLRIKPDSTLGHNALANALQDLEAFDEAEQHYRRCLELGGDPAEVYGNMGNLFHAKGDYQQAWEHYQKSLEYKPDAVPTIASLAFLYFRYGRFNEARRCFDQAVNLEPNNPSVRWNRALLLLLQGEMEQGWEDYEARFATLGTVKQFGRRSFDKPLWDGRRIQDKTLLVHAEQGLGDTIQFCRYLALIKERVGRIVFECQPELLPLLKQVGGADEVVSDASATAFDYYIPLLSLPRLCHTRVENIPSDPSYLQADPAKVGEWAGRIASGDKKVGLVWAGNPGNLSDRRRSLELAQLQGLLAIPGIQFFSLQKGEAAQQCAGTSIIDLQNQLTDFAETAAAIANLDLVITVDTAVAHLAGALGKPVWTLIYFPSDWRWFLDRSDSPWYPAMRLFRQTEIGQWSPVIAELTEALAEFARG